MLLLFPFSLKPLLWQVSCTCKEKMLRIATKRSQTKSKPGWFPLQSVIFVYWRFLSGHISSWLSILWVCIWELSFSAFGVHFQRLPQHGHAERLSVPAVLFSYYLAFVLAMPSCPSWLTRKGWPLFCCTDLNNLKLTFYFWVSSTRVESQDPCLNPCPSSVFFAVRS